MGLIIALGVFAIVAPLMAWLGVRYGRTARGGIGLLLMGLGQVADPPLRHLVEANGGEEKEAPAPGDPPRGLSEDLGDGLAADARSIPRRRPCLEIMVNHPLTARRHGALMRRVLILCVLALAMAAPAGAQEKKARPRVPPPAPSAGPALRGSIPGAAMSPATRPPPVDLNTAQSLFLPSPIASAPVGGAPQQCRLSCAQTYYFCAAAEDGESCSANWSQCRSGCDAPTLATSY